MISKVERALKALEIPHGSAVAVAFSGGCDSSALLHCLYTLKDKFGLTLCAVHVDHSLRGAESDRDAVFAAAVCGKYGIECHVEKVDVSGECAVTGESTELCARRLRYGVLDRFAENGWLVATAHTASDNAETVLFNLVRGSGVTGMSGIPRRRGNYIRPILDCTRDETESYCRENGIEYVTDSSNLTDDYTRNFLRHNVIPQLKRINGSLETTITGMTGQMRDIDVMLSDMADKALDDCRTDGGYDCGKLSAYPVPVLSEAVRKAALSAAGRAPDNDKTHDLCDIVINGGRTELYNGWYASGGRKFYFYRRLPKNMTETELTEGITEFGNVTVEIKTVSQNVHNLLMQNAIDCDKIKGTAIIRSRRQGDTVKLAGRPEKQLRRLMNEMSIPEGERDAFPVVADDVGILFVPGAGVAERAKPDKNTGKMIIITLRGGQC